MIDERIMSLSFTIYFRKNSYLITSVNEELQLYITHGLLLHWERKYIDEKFIDKKLMQYSSGQVKALRWEDIEGLFQVFGCLLVIAMVSFVLEVISKKTRMKTRL